MSLTCLTYVPPIRHGTRPRRPDYEQLEAAVALNEEGKHLEAIHKVFAHLFVDVAVPDLTKKAFSFVQGSSRVTAKIDGDDLVMSVPLVRLPEGGRAIAALRFVLTKLAANGQLHQPRLHGDDIYLEYRDRVARMHPAKVVEVLRRMPTQADVNDDWLIGQFGALPLERADLGTLSSDELARADIDLARPLARGRGAVEGVAAQAIDVLPERAHRVRGAPPELRAAADRVRRVAARRGRGDVQRRPGRPEQARGVAGEGDQGHQGRHAGELHGSLGHATYAISPLAEGTPKVLSGYFAGGNYIETIDKYRKTDKQIDAALALIVHVQLPARALLVARAGRAGARGRAREERRASRGARRPT